VGKAWEQDNTVHFDFADPRVQAVESPEDFARLPDDLRLSASYEGFLVGRRDFRAVWATPIHDGTGGFLAVLSLNLDREITVPFDQLNAIVRPAVRDLAATIGVLAAGV
jgi:hypothetical protein